MAGDFAIDARSASGDLRAWLEVAVKPYKSITVAFNFVRDTAVANGKDVHQGTRRNHSEVEGMLATMNRIYAPLNVQFVQQSIRDITVPSSLGPAVDVSLKPLYRPPYQTYPTRQEWEIINDQADATANWNVFFVWKLNVYQQKGAAAIARKGGPCFFDDSVEYPGRTLAHEARHFFGLADDYSGPRHNLLYPYNGSRGEAIPRPHADLINPSGPKPKLLH